jgi:hypothetical protein
VVESFINNLKIISILQDIHISLHNEWEPLSPSAYLVCLGFGLQNGMCTTFSGAVIRTTHVTGTVTDIGLIIGQAIFHQRTRKHLWKLKILIPLYTSFCCGAVIGWFAFELMHNRAIILPCGIIGCLGVGHISYCKIFLKLNLRKIKDKNNDIFGSSKLCTLIAEPVVEPNIQFTKQSSDTDHVDSEDEPNELENSAQTQALLIPLVITIVDTTGNQEETK